MFIVRVGVRISGVSIYSFWYLMLIIITVITITIASPNVSWRTLSSAGIPVAEGH